MRDFRMRSDSFIFLTPHSGDTCVDTSNDLVAGFGYDFVNSYTQLRLKNSNSFVNTVILRNSLLRRRKGKLQKHSNHIYRTQNKIPFMETVL